jgi:hypothetical protein
MMNKIDDLVWPGGWYVKVKRCEHPLGTEMKYLAWASKSQLTANGPLEEAKAKAKEVHWQFGQTYGKTLEDLHRQLIVEDNADKESKWFDRCVVSLLLIVIFGVTAWSLFAR